MNLLINAGKIIKGTGEAPIIQGAILINDNKIVEVGQQGEVRIKNGTKVLDFSDMTVVPGLIDCHVHLCHTFKTLTHSKYIAEEITKSVILGVTNAQQCLKSGVLTVRDLGCGHTGIFQIRSALNSGQIIGPRLFVCGQPIAISGGHWWQISREADSPNEIRKAVREQLRWGADCIKFMVTGGAGFQYEELTDLQMNLNELIAGVEEAKKRNKRLCAHATNPTGVINCVEAGVDSIEHGTILNENALEEMKNTDSFYVPTLFCYWEIAKNGRKLGAREDNILKAREIIDSHREAFQSAYRMGINIATGTDRVWGNFFVGDSLISEMELMEKYGMAPMDILKAATYTSACNLGIENIVGTLEKGKLADLVIINGDPLKKICNLRRVSYVFKEGRNVYKRDLKEI
jgi:imidazolonepropionase-like amidohydrolase